MTYMAIDYWNSSDSYLEHFGVKGMKWGVRHDPEAQRLKQNYKAAKKEYKRYRRREIFGGFGVKGIDRYRNAISNVDSAEMKMLDAKAAYKKKTKGQKAELNVYRKAMQRTGLRNSAADSYSRRNIYGKNGEIKGMTAGRSTRIYNHVSTKYGKKAADRIEKSVQNRAVALLVGSTALAIGASVAPLILENRYNY